MLYRAGARILVGTHAPQPKLPPGYSLHKEMELTVESGRPPADVVRAVTRLNAEILGQAKTMGRVASGTVADLVLLDANWVDDIRNSRRIWRGIRDGASLDSKQILGSL